MSKDRDYHLQEADRALIRCKEKLFSDNDAKAALDELRHVGKHLLDIERERDKPKEWETCPPETLLPEKQQALAARDAKWQAAWNGPYTNPNFGPRTPEELRIFREQTERVHAEVLENMRSKPLALVKRWEIMGTDDDNHAQSRVAYIDCAGMLERALKTEELSAHTCCVMLPFRPHKECTACVNERKRVFDKPWRLNECTCAEIQRQDPLRHFRECPLRKPLPEGHPQADKPGPQLNAFAAWCQAHELKIEVHEREDGNLPKYWVRFWPHVEQMDRGFLSAVNGNGATLQEAAEALAQNTLGKRLAVNAYSSLRREIQAPHSWERDISSLMQRAL